MRPLFNRPIICAKNSLRFRNVDLLSPKPPYMKPLVEYLRIAHAIQLQNVVRRTHQGPFCLNLFNPSHEKLSEAPGMFDLPKYRFHNRFPRRVDFGAGLGLEFPCHSIHNGRSLRQRTPFAGWLLSPVFLSVRRNIRRNFSSFADISGCSQSNIRCRPEVQRAFVQPVSG